MMMGRFVPLLHLLMSFLLRQLCACLMELQRSTTSTGHLRTTIQIFPNTPVDAAGEVRCVDPDSAFFVEWDVKI